MEKQIMKLNRKVLRKEKNAEISLDVIVPDVKPDIVSILNTNANSYIYKEEITKGKIRLDGNVDSFVVYLAETGETRSLAINMDFIETMEDDNINESMRYKTNVRVKNIETKILNERKINVVAKLILESEFYESSEVEFLKSSEEDCDIQKKEKNYKLKKLIGTNKSKASIKEDMNLETADSIAEILKTEINILNVENKVSYNKILAKADVNIKIVYQTENMKVGVLNGAFPVMSFIDIENVEESNICETDFKVRNMLFKINSTESNKITVQVDFESSVEVYEAQEINIIQDMYSLEKEINFTRREIEVALNSEIKKENVKISERVLIEDITNIIDISSRVDIVTKTNAGSYVNYELDAVLDVMYEADNRSGVNSKNIRLPFVVKVENDSSNNPNFSILNQDFKLDNEQLLCDMEIEYKTCKDKVNKISILENIEEKECETKNEYSMVVYFVKPCDTIWKIAKMFKVTEASIIEANNLENPDKINVGEKLYIVK